MALNDAALFRAWGPPCSGRSATISLYGNGKVTVHPALIEAVGALDKCLRHWNYVTRAVDTGAYSCRDKVGQPGRKSIHALKVALDINWQTNPFGRRLITDMPRPMVDAICAIRANNGAQVWTWGGNWSGNKDAMHYQAGCAPADLATGINWSTVPGGGGAVRPVPPVRPAPGRPQTETEEEDMARFVQVSDDPTQAGDLPRGAVVKLTATTYAWISQPDSWDAEVRFARIVGQDPTPAPISNADLRALKRSLLDAPSLNAAAARVNQSPKL